MLRRFRVLRGAARLAPFAIATAAVLTGGGWAQAQEADCYISRPFETPAVPAKTETIAGRPVIRHLPPHPKGVVYLFHGTGGSEKFATRIHSQRVLATLIAGGYGYVSPQSLDRSVQRWNLEDAGAASNPDIAYVLALHRALIERGEIAKETPVFTMGMSNGGGFANLFALVAKLQGLPVAAVADYMGPFPPTMRGLLPDAKALPPTLVILSQNDGLVSAERTGAVAADLAKRGAKVETHLNLEHRVCADTFAVEPQIGPAAREALVRTILPAKGVIDASGKRTVFTGKAVIGRDEMASLLTTLNGVDHARDVLNELIIAWAGHQMRSEYAERQRAFFDEALAARR